MGNLLSALAQFVEALFNIYLLILVIRILVSWVNPDPFNPIMQFLTRVTDPVLEPARRIIPPIGPLDISPILVFLVLRFLQSFLIKTLLDLSVRMR